MLNHKIVVDIQIDWRSLIIFKQRLLIRLRNVEKQSFATNGIEAFKGEACFTPPDIIDLDGRYLKARNIPNCFSCMNLDRVEVLRKSVGTRDLDDQRLTPYPSTACILRTEIENVWDRKTAYNR